MFSPTRHLTHQTLCLNVRNNNSILTREEKDKHRHQGSGHQELRLRFLFYMGEHGFLQYTRRVHIGGSVRFTPETLLPHLHYFQSLDHVHTLVFEGYRAAPWVCRHNTRFTHFYPTLTSLTLTRPAGKYRTIMRFALQFPNLESLCFEWLVDDEETRLGLDVRVFVEKFPPLRGHLRLASEAQTQWLEDVSRDLQDSNFRSVEIEAGFLGHYVQPILNMCTHRWKSHHRVPRNRWASVSHRVLRDHRSNFSMVAHRLFTRLELTGMGALRRLTLRMEFRYATAAEENFLIALLSTIKSQFFCEFVLELEKLPSLFDPLVDWDHWVDIDEFLEGRFASRGDFKFVIRTAEPYDRATFRRHAKLGFPLLVGRKCLHFEMSNR